MKAGREVGVDLRGVDRSDVPAVLHGIAAHYGLLELMKGEAHEGEVDLRSPKLMRLIKLARNSWQEWGEKLVDELVDLADRGRLVPLTAEHEAALVELFRDHEAALVVRLTGRAPAAMMERLIARKLVAPDIDKSALIPVAFKLGRMLDVMQSLPEQPESRATLAELVRDSLVKPLSTTDQGALEYVQRRGYSLMRRPAVSVTGDVFAEIANVDRRLSVEQVTALQGAADTALKERASKTRWRELLHEAVKGHESLQNDLDRIAKTEAAFAHGYGAYRTIKERAAATGEADPLVFRYASDRGCTECRRIWGPSSKPTVYKLSQIEAREASGGNFRVPRAEWGPVIGPTHPNCLCSPLMRWSKSVGLAEARARQILGR